MPIWTRYSDCVRCPVPASLHGALLAVLIILSAGTAVGCTGPGAEPLASVDSYCTADGISLSASAQEVAEWLSTSAATPLATIGTLPPVLEMREGPERRLVNRRSDGTIQSITTSGLPSLSVGTVVERWGEPEQSTQPWRITGTVVDDLLGVKYDLYFPALGGDALLRVGAHSGLSWPQDTITLDGSHQIQGTFVCQRLSASPLEPRIQWPGFGQTMPVRLQPFF